MVQQQNKMRNSFVKQTRAWFPGKWQQIALICDKCSMRSYDLLVIITEGTAPWSFTSELKLSKNAGTAVQAESDTQIVGNQWIVSCTYSCCHSTF